MELFIVYKHTAPNGKSYIGITSRNPEVRWKNGHGYQGQKKFYNAILKYGWDNFTHEILFEGLTKELACQREIDLIRQYDSVRNGYNVSTGGEYASSGTYKFLIGEVYSGFKVVGRNGVKLELHCLNCGAVLERYVSSLQNHDIKCRCKLKYNPNPKPKNYCIIEYKGKKQSVQQWSKELNIPVGTIRQRYKKGQPIDEARQGIINVGVCEICGNEFVKKNKAQKYCCQECQWKSMKINRGASNCLNCGKEFTINRPVDSNYRAKFCCIKCRIEWQQKVSREKDGKYGEKARTV